MDIDQSAVFFVGSILVCMGLVVVAATVLFLNNIYSKYWKPIEWRVFKMFDYPPAFHYNQEPHLDEKKKDEPIKQDSLDPTRK